MEVLTEMDEYFNAMSKIDMDEPVMPYVKGRLVESDTYNKVQKILNTPELEKAHMYCYDLDLENLEECDVMKINNLYKLGVDRGFIDDDLQYQDVDASNDQGAVEPEVKEPAPQPVNPRAKIPCFVAMYSAMKDGQIKTGEAYSRAISVQAAKADVIAQLSRFGYSNISILAIEATEEDACACSLAAKDDVGSGVALGEDDYLKGRVHNGHLDEGEAFDEDDMLDGRFHNHHIPEAEEDDAAGDDDTADDSSTEEDSGSDDSGSEDSADDSGDDSADSDVSFDLDDDSDDGDEDDDSSTDDTAEDSEDSEDSSSDEDAGEDAGEDASEDSEDSEDADDDSGNSDDDSDDDSSDDPDDDSDDDSDDSDDDSDDDKEELDDNKKADLKDNYKKAFKNIMLKCKFEDRAFDDLTLKEKVKFFTELSKAWKEDYEPSDFMSDKEVDQLNKIVVKK